MMYDFLIVGAGFFGATCARILTDAGYKCLIIEKEKTVGGLCSTYFEKDILIHKYGLHILHTDNENVYNFLSKYGTLEDINYNVKILNNNTYYNLPFNMNLFYDLYKTKYETEAKTIIQEDRNKYGTLYERNLQEELIHLGGFKTYINIKNYYEKLYGQDCKDMPKNYCQEIRNDYTYNTNYYPEKYVCTPKDGYTKIIENIIGDDIDILLGTDFIENKNKFLKIASVVIASCPIDRFCEYIYGPLDWKCIKFELKDFTKESDGSFLGFPSLKISDTNNMMIQIDEFKYVQKNIKSNNTYLIYYLPDKWEQNKKEMFCFNNFDNEDLVKKYINFITENYPNVLFSGHLGMFRNFSISETVSLAMDLCEELINELTS